ncbi:hypothetical protein [Mangrovicoccus sp. HB161399]|uniref:hypothetical protein n=1 Tax=Mangrovicoccus sp. HB161399 TaxID=2720392 RepID=UPI0015530436|nr:hypothetical protein [Mangrovicoccus sp. HB161399]
MRLLALAALALLAACGVDGPPLKPQPQQQEETAARRPGVTVSGSASMGVAGSSFSR